LKQLLVSPILIGNARVTRLHRLLRRGKRATGGNNSRRQQSDTESLETTKDHHHRNLHFLRTSRATRKGTPGWGLHHEPGGEPYRTRPTWPVSARASSHSPPPTPTATATTITALRNVSMKDVLSQSGRPSSLPEPEVSQDDENDDDDPDDGEQVHALIPLHPL
jgi:hypothetical protein